MFLFAITLFGTRFYRVSCKSFVPYDILMDTWLSLPRSGKGLKFWHAAQKVTALNKNDSCDKFIVPYSILLHPWQILIHQCILSFEP